MKRMMRTAGVMVVIAGAGLGAAAMQPPAAEEKAPTPKEAVEQQAEEMAVMNAIRPEHKLLASMCGEYDLTMTVYPMPGMDPLTIKGTAKREMILNGQFMQERVEATGGPMPFSSLSHMGYNADAEGGGRFEVNRMSSTVNVMMPEQGTFDEATRTFTLNGSHDVNGMRGSIRVIVKLLEEGKETAEVHLSFEG